MRRYMSIVSNQYVDVPSPLNIFDGNYLPASNGTRRRFFAPTTHNSDVESDLGMDVDANVTGNTDVDVDTDYEDNASDD
jgi:hypothetical protein